jgi:hypothetical protein
MHEHDWRNIDRIPGWMTREECEWLAAQAAQVQSWTEVGVFCGRSALVVALHLPPAARLQLVDVELGTVTRAGQSFLTTYQQICQRRPDLQLVLYRGPSIEAAALLPAAAVVFVDASHAYHAVRNDIDAWFAKSSHLCGHDYGCPTWPGVQRAVDEAFQQVNTPAGTIWSEPLRLLRDPAAETGGTAGETE